MSRATDQLILDMVGRLEVVISIGYSAYGDT
jgi:hypothetical protein